jgi:hypothetical protein
MLINNLIQAIITKWGTLNSGYPMYFNHAPQSQTNAKTLYPFIVVNLIDSPRTYSMRDDTNLTPNVGNHTYSKARIQFTTWCNEEQFTLLMTIADLIESTYQFVELNTTTPVKNMGSYVLNQTISFYEVSEKVYALKTDVLFYVGK